MSTNKLAMATGLLAAALVVGMVHGQFRERIRGGNRKGRQHARPT